MVRLVLMISLLSFFLWIPPWLAHAEQVEKIDVLPDWVSMYQHTSETLTKGAKLNWKLAPRVPPSKDEQEVTDIEQFKGALLPVRKGQPVKISVTSDKGFPVVMISDGPLEQFGKEMAKMLKGGETIKGIPGNPVAYAIGTTNQVTVTVTPPYNGIWQVWVWVLPDKLKPYSSELPEEIIAEWESQGYTREQIQRIFNVPEILQAW